MGNAFGTTALTPPVLDGIGRLPVTNTTCTEPPEPLDIKRVMRAVDELEEYREAERRGQQFLRDATALGIAQLVVDGRMDDARAVAAGARDLLWGDVFKVRFAPGDFTPAGGGRG